MTLVMPVGKLRGLAAPRMEKESIPLYLLLLPFSNYDKAVPVLVLPLVASVVPIGIFLTPLNSVYTATATLCS